MTYSTYRTYLGVLQSKDAPRSQRTWRALRSIDSVRLITSGCLSAVIANDDVLVLTSERHAQQLS